MNNEPCGNTQAEIDRDHTPKRVIDRSVMNERESCESIEDIRYSNIVYQNTIAALLAGATLTARDGKSKWFLTDDIIAMAPAERELEAKVMASYVVG